MKRIAALLALALVAADTPDISIPADFGLIEGIAFDPNSRQFYAGAVEDGALLIKEGDRWRRTVLPYRTAGLFGMALDRQRGILWIASGVAGPTKAKQGFRGIIGVTALGLEAAGRAAVPVADANAQPGDVAVGPDGTVYVSDGQAGNLYVCRPGCTELLAFVPPGTFKSPQGLAVSRDGKALYVADYGRGLWRIDLKKPKIVSQISQLNGIDGLVRDGDALIAIVNGDGRKIVRLALDPTGTSVASEAVLATPAGPGDPTLGIIVGGKLLYVADAQWDRFDDQGVSKSPARTTHIESLQLPPGPRPPEMRGKPEKERRPSRLSF